SLGRGRYSEALLVLKAAEQLYPSERCRLHMYWARLKLDGQVGDTDLPAIDRDIKGMSAGMRKTALWIFINGLLKRYAKDYPGAYEQFQRAVHEDSSFMDA